MAEIKFEDALKKLEKIVSDLETGEMSLDESLSKYEEGIKLSKLCSRQLEAAKSRVELLMKTGTKFDVKPLKSKNSPTLF
jgi:exodeoxyribonuclease VII small subunit